MPSAILPYLMVFIVLLIFFSTKVSLFSQIMEIVFQNNALQVLLVLAICIFLAFILTAIFLLLSIKNDWDPLSLAKTAMIVKIIQIPAYIAIFVLGLVCMLSIFTYVAAALFAIFDFLCLILTGMITSAAVINALKAKRTTLKSCWWVLAMQFVFCADVVAAILFYKRLEANTKTIT